LVLLPHLVPEFFENYQILAEGLIYDLFGESGGIFEMTGQFFSVPGGIETRLEISLRVPLIKLLK
jgi:hypothetical protein